MSSFRPATANDVDAIAGIYLTSRNAFVTYAPLIKADIGFDMWIRLKLLPSTHITLVEREGEAIGMMAVAKKWHAAGNRYIGWIEQLYLLPGHVGQGIGSTLVERAKAELGSPIRLYTFQENHGARRFYERHGFRAIQFGDGSGNEEGCPDVLYEWRGDPVAE